MYICVSSDPVYAQGVETQWLVFLIAHEVMHLAQFQLGGAVRHERGPEALLEFHGPVWLSEGIAQAFANRVAIDTPDWDYRIVNYRRLENQFPDLAELEYESALDRRKSDVYRAGTVGAIDLIDLFGYPAIGEFYANLGEGLAWQAAFEDAFGITANAFYIHYKNIARFDAAGMPVQGPLGEIYQ